MIKPSITYLNYNVLLIFLLILKELNILNKLHTLTFYFILVLNPSYVIILWLLGHYIGIIKLAHLFILWFFLESGFAYTNLHLVCELPDNMITNINTKNLLILGLELIISTIDNMNYLFKEATSIDSSIFLLLLNSDSFLQKIVELNTHNSFFIMVNDIQNLVLLNIFAIFCLLVTLYTSKRLIIIF